MADGNVAADELRLLIERIERLNEDKKAIGEDISDVYKEAKGRGYDPATMRALVRLRKLETAKRQESLALLDTYGAALGLWDETPLGRVSAAIRRLDDSDTCMSVSAGTGDGGREIFVNKAEKARRMKAAKAADPAAVMQ